MKIDWLLIAGSLNFLVGLLHLAIIFGGASWYRFFGAGEKFARMAEKGMLYPHLITATIAIIFFIWGLFAWSGSGLILKLPLLKLTLFLITAVFLIRGLLGIPLWLWSNNPHIQSLSFPFVLWSSLICLAIGCIHLVGTLSLWTK